MPKFTLSAAFYPKLAREGYSSVARWTRKVDIFQLNIGKESFPLIFLHLQPSVKGETNFGWNYLGVLSVFCFSVHADSSRCALGVGSD